VLHRFLAISTLLVCAGAPSAASAFSSPEAFSDDADNGGGGGRWFSGSPAEGFGCSTCHVQAATQRDFPLTVIGLPPAYLPGGQYEITLTWPEFAQRWRELRPNPMMPPPPEAPSPSAGLITELFAESGSASGVVTINTVGATAAELCEMTRPNLQPRLGVRLYQVRAGLEPIQIRPDANGLLRCEARRLGQRCLIGLAGCGAQQVRFTWTAPPTWQGPIWFSAGFVASEATSRTADLDAVDEVAVPVLQAGTEGGVYKDRLQRGCALAPGRAQGRASAIAIAFVLLALIGRKRREEKC
jgi:hypothetical protein